MISLRKTSKENLNFARRDKGLAFQIPSMYYLANLICPFVTVQTFCDSSPLFQHDLCRRCFRLGDDCSESGRAPCLMFVAILA